MLNSYRSNIDLEHIKQCAADLNFEILNEQDADDFLILLQSLEAVMRQVDEDTDFIDPRLEPQQTTVPREFWVPDSKTDNPFNAWSHRCNLEAASPTSQVLKGRTIAIKDNICVGGVPTTCGTFAELLSKDGTFPVSTIDATVVARLLAAGAIVKGTSTCENYCASPLSYTSASGPVHHPLLHGYTTGGSSSGSCALVAAAALRQRGHLQDKNIGDTVELAIGGDQAGSVRIPSSYTGVYGLKPTHGFIPYTGAVSMSPMIDHLGPIAAGLEDIALLLKVMAGYDGMDSRMTPESPLVGHVKDYPQLLALSRDSSNRQSSTPGKRLRVGILKEAFEVPNLSTQVRDTVLQSARTFFEAAGASLTEISIPMHAQGPLIWTAATRPSMSKWSCAGNPSGYLSYLPPHVKAKWPPSQAMYELLTGSNPALVNIMLSGAFADRYLDSSSEAKAHRKVFELRAAYDAAFQEVDVLITPCAPTVAMPHPQTQSGGKRTGVMEKLKVAVGLTNNTSPFNVTGHPALSAPCGYGTVPARPDVQLPIGMQIVGRRWDEETILMAAAVFEAGRKKVEG